MTTARVIGFTAEKKLLFCSLDRVFKVIRVTAAFLQAYELLERDCCRLACDEGAFRAGLLQVGLRRGSF
jgi:hypothetical protein